MLVDHADAKCDRIVRRLYIVRMTFNQNLTAVRSVKAVGDTHRRRLPGAIFPNNGVNRPRLNHNIHIIVSQNRTKAF